MEISEYRTIFEQEDNHFFYIANHKIILSLIKSYLGQVSSLKILDAGCGTGLLTKKLERFGKVLGIDLSEEALKYARKRRIKAKLGSINNLPFRDQAFDLVVSMDVIYHKAVQDTIALEQLKRVLKPNGLLILRVPANEWLRSSHDLQVHTRERYSLETLRTKLERAGFKIEKISYVQMLLVPISLISLLWEKLLTNKIAKTHLVILPNSLNRFIADILSLEVSILRKFNLPFGLGLIAVARKT